jgi:hypothetical protein
MKLASWVARNIQKGRCITGLMLVPVVCVIRTVKAYWRARSGCVSSSISQVWLQRVHVSKQVLPLWHRQHVTGWIVYVRVILRVSEDWCNCTTASFAIVQHYALIIATGEWGDSVQDTEVLRTERYVLFWNGQRGRPEVYAMDVELRCQGLDVDKLD